MVNIGGKKVNPLFVEKVILSYPSVREAVVLGYRRTSGEELLAAVIVTNKDLEQKQFNEFLNSKLERYMLPSIIRFSGSIPRDEMGKLKREEMLNLIAEKSTT